jgi:PAS domain S-box-containing protein
MTAAGIVFQLADRTIAACDPAASEILGYKTEDLVGKVLWDLPWQTIVPTGWPSLLEHPAIVALRTGQPVLDAVMGFDRPNGEFVWLKLDARPLFAANSTTPYGVVTAICEVTEQKKHLITSPGPEAQINPPETANNFPNPAYQIELETLYTTAPIGLCFIDTDLRFVRINQQLADINGFAIGDHIGHTLREMLPDQADELEPIYRQVIASGEPLLNLEFRGVNRAEPGIERDWLLNLSPLQSDNGVVFGVNAMVQEITDRKHIEQALIDSENRVSTILESMSDGFLALDRQWRFTYANQQGVEVIRYLTNLEADAFLGKSHWEIFPWGVGKIVEQEYRRAITEQVAVHFEFQYEPTGDWFEVHAYPSAAGLGIYFRNISDRKLAEAALGESEHRYRRLFEAMDQGFCLCEILLNENGEPTDYRFLEVNPMFEKMTELKEPVGKTALQLVPNLEAFWIETYGQVALTGEPARFENGSEAMNKWFEVRAFRVDGPQSLKVAILFTNITDRKLAEIALQKSQERLSLAIESAGMATWDMNMQTRRGIWSKSFFRLLGYEPVATGEATFEMWRSRLHPDDLERVMQKLESAQNTRSLYNPEYRIIRADTGEIRWIKAFGRFLDDETGLATRFTGVLFDASDRKLAEITLQQSRETIVRQLMEIELIYQTAPIGLAVLDRNLRFMRLNPRLAEINGISVNDHLGRTVREILPKLADEVEPLFYRVLETGEPILDIEVRGETPAQPGVYRTWLENWFPLRDLDGQAIGINVVVQEVTDRKQAEIEREQLLDRERLARAESERANRIKDEFLAVLSHELRSPLNPILGWVKLLQTRKFDETRTKAALATIERNAQLQAQLIEDLLDISRIMGGKLSLNAVPVSLTFVISSAIETVRLAAEAKNIQLIALLDAKVDRVFGDPGRLQQVVWNLLSNAVKFTPIGGQVTIRLTQVDGNAQIEVIDTGMGINPEFLPYVFEYFRQADASTTRKFGGLGLGLAIARQIVEMHGGRIWADSQGLDAGTTFAVRIPLLAGAKSALQTAVSRSSPNVDSLPLTGIRTLIVDDDNDTREFLAFLLEESGAVVRAAASASEALQSLKQAEVDILLSDIGMPGMDGYTLIATVRSLEQCQTLPAIALTAYASDGDKQRAIAAGFQNHIPKPIDPTQLIAAILQLAQPSY